ncbi:MAG: riboflavin synthase [Acidobacteria bacterium]|nr:riboflavin synthase [Acidobacteriota bacterium]
MFTGLIETVGRVGAVQALGSGVQLEIETPFADEVVAGDSLAVNGVCLTVTPAEAGRLRADVGPETLRVTTLGSMQSQHLVNLERAMRADARFGGHFVQGHVDGTGVVQSVRPDGDSHWLTISLDRSLAPYCIPKGSIAVDGISLTIAALRDLEFDVMIIPYTWQHTNVHTRRAGDRVNLECDMVGKYVARAAQLAMTAS